MVCQSPAPDALTLNTSADADECDLEDDDDDDADDDDDDADDNDDVSATATAADVEAAADANEDARRGRKLVLDATSAVAEGNVVIVVEADTSGRLRFNTPVTSLLAGTLWKSLDWDADASLKYDLRMAMEKTTAKPGNW